ncbi:Hypothetical protein SCF082_LOCUS30348 [Durusdinium trenchii]|uniref:Uncharacterized protein n=1 Tax=Durusdinium trenchii TaxID=1381693 RepID=A0ABP0MY60_9DINO
MEVDASAKRDLLEDAATWLEKATEVLSLNPRSAAQMALRAQALAEMAGAQGAQASALLISAQVSLHQGKSKAARAAAQRACRLFKQDGDTMGTARAAFEAARAELMALESGSREPTQTAWESLRQNAKEAQLLASAVGLNDFAAAALSLLAKAQTALGQQEDAEKSSADAAEKLRKQSGSKAVDAKLAKLVTQLSSQEGLPAVKLGREALEKDTSLVTLPADPDEEEAARKFAHREAAARSQEQPTVLVRQATGLLVEASTSLPFQVAMRRDNAGTPSQVIARYYQHARSVNTMPIIDIPV